MIRNIKALGLALVAMMALGAVLASAAQAAREAVVIDTNPAIVTGEIKAGTQHILKIPPLEIKCEVANLEGTAEQTPGQESQQTVEDLTVTATYSNCHGIVVRMNGCKYTITGETQAQPTTTTAQAKVTGCTANKVIEVESPFVCTITIGEQNYLSHVIFSNTNPGLGKPDETQTKDIDVNATVSGIQWTGDGGLCPTPGTGASFNGETTVRAFEDTQTQEQVTQHGHQFTRHICGTQVGIFAE